MPIHGFKVIYQERVYHCLSVMPEYRDATFNVNEPFKKPIFVEATIINEDGNICVIRDEAWMFQFVPRVEGR